MREPSVDMKVNISTILTYKPCWMDPIDEFLAENRLPSEAKEAEKVCRVSAQFWLSKDCRLYQRSFGGPYLLFLRPNKVDELLTELYEGICGNHVGGQSLAHRAMTQWFWWPKMQKDAAEYVQKCEQCQKHAPLIYQPVGNLNLISNP